MKRFATLFFAYFVSVIVSAFLIMGDVDVNGIQGLLTSSGLITLVLFSLIPFSIICLTLFICKRLGSWKGFLALFVMVLILMYILMMWSQPTLSLSQKIETMLKSSLFIFIVFFLGAFPYWLLNVKNRELKVN